MGKIVVRQTTFVVLLMFLVGLFIGLAIYSTREPTAPFVAYQIRIDYRERSSGG